MVVDCRRLKQRRGIDFGARRTDAGEVGNGAADDAGADPSLAPSLSRLERVDRLPWFVSDFVGRVGRD